VTIPDAGWQPVAALADLQQTGKLVVKVNDVPILLLWHEGAPVAMNDTCIHKGRSLSEGVLLNGRLVCAGHQWAFDLTTGLCRVRERYQPMPPVRIAGDQVEIDASQIVASEPAIAPGA
jgi:nitrite reductase (NADH) small subunit